MTAGKDTVRTRLQANRKGMTRPERREADESTWDDLRVYLADRLPGGGTVAAYRPFGFEPGATLEPELPERIADLGMQVILPVTLPDNDLDWINLGDEQLSTEQPGPPVLAPEGLGPAVVTPEGLIPMALTPEGIARADAVVVPGLAVGADGVRLGRGGGSYDRALARSRPGVPVIALLRDGEYPVELPSEPHDRPVNAVITPTDGCITIGRASLPGGMDLAT